MLPVSLDCPFTQPRWYSLTCICPVSCVSYVASFSGLSFYITPWVFSNMYLSSVLCILCCQFLWIVLLHYALYSLTCICPVSCVSYVASFSLSFLPLQYSLTCICPVSCVSYVASFSGLSFYTAPLVFSNMYLSCVLCILCCQFLWIVLLHYPFGIL